MTPEHACYMTISKAISQAKLLYAGCNGEIPQVAKLIATRCDRTEIETLMELLQEAQCIEETGVDSPGV